MVRIGFAAMCENRKFKLGNVSRGAPLERRRNGGALASLLASDLRERFYSWRGISGRSYICSVFSLAETSTVLEFTSAAVIGVASDGAARRPICVMSSREFRLLEDASWRDDFSGRGVNEWHVQFEVDEEGLRDLAGSLLS